MRFTAVGIIFFLLSACASAETVIERPINVSSFSSVSSDTSVASTSTLPSSESVQSPAVRISMPFATQAPHGNWGMPYQEACEEASLILVHHYLEQTPLSEEMMDKDILALVAFQEATGLPPDITMMELADVAESYYGYKTTINEGADVTIENIEAELARGNPVIVPLAGQDIGNPYYSGDGPPYHVFVILGYDDDEFITHDVGTKHGENYHYNKDVIMNAIHDWTGNKETIRTGPKRMLVVRKKIDP